VPCKHSVSTVSLSKYSVGRLFTPAASLCIFQFTIGKSKENDLLNCGCDHDITCSVPAQTHDVGSGTLTASDRCPGLSSLELGFDIKDVHVVIIAHIGACDFATITTESDMLDSFDHGSVC
jgi:hypothetical protein